jgi:hypothetical protein
MSDQAHETYQPKRLTADEMRINLDMSREIASQVRKLGASALKIATEINGHFEANANGEYEQLMSEPAAAEAIQNMTSAFGDVDFDSIPSVIA